MKQKSPIKSSTMFTRSIKDTLITLLILTVTTLVCYLLRMPFSESRFSPNLYILAIFLIARFTDGYLYGIVSSVIAVFAVNYFFTYPFFHMNFTITGYPATFICMLSVALVTSALTSRIKEQSNIKVEVEKEKTKSNLLRAVSHDLRTPLTSIYGSSSAIIENNAKLSTEEKIQLVKDIRDDSQWLISMVENLLSITRVGDGENAKVVKRSEIAEEIMGVSVRNFLKRYPDFTVNVSVPDEVMIIPMDAMLIEQVIVNLLENVVLHAEGATKADFYVRHEGDNAVFTVSDNGCGIPNEKLPYVFDVMSSFGEQRADSKKNMGIGLSVCRTIINAHGGEIYAENQKSGGAAFSFSLPLNGDEE